MVDAPPQLDPKIKEAYDKVMNTAIAAAPPADSQPPPPQPSTQPPPQPTITQVMPTVTPPRREPATIHIGGVPASHASTTEKKSKILPVLYITGGIIFLLVYTIFWLKFFNIPTPFLPF